MHELAENNIQTNDLNDYTLGHTLDQIADFGSSPLFASVAFGIAMENNLLGNLSHIDTTSISVSGEYAQNQVIDDELIAWKAVSDGYKTESKVSNYGGIEQRWLLVFSEKAYQKEKQTCEKNWIKMEARLQRKGRFILATNELNLDNYSDEQMLREYKEQQHVERGFRFLKDPWFMVDSIFLKSARRIEALMMVMTLCLLVYNIGQYQLRKKLKDEKLTLPNQLGKQVQNPTMKWIFQIMEGVGVVRFYESGRVDPVKELVTNMNDLRQKIIRLFGPTACSMYGLIAKSGV